MTPDCAPETIIIHFPNYTGPQFFLDKNKKNWIPINPLSIYSKEAGASRRQFPIRLAHAMTSHKTQGETLDKGIIHVGNFERHLGTTFVQFSRFKKYTDFIIEPFSFDRLTKIANHSSLPPRLKEEERLAKLNKLTNEKYKYLLD
jgi:hypothetical protein